MATSVPRPASAELATALRSLGAADAAPSERWEGDAWVADWDGPVRGHDVYVLVMGARSHPEGVRLMLDDLTFDDVRPEDVGGNWCARRSPAAPG
ncbi:hypothetical protein GCM10020295_57890 [Streptomyces cinereospinus]